MTASSSSKITNGKRGSMFWDQQAVALCKQSVKQEIAEVRNGSTREECLNFILNQIELLTRSTDESSRLRCFVFGMSALVHHERFGGLKNKNIRTITKLLHDLLTLSGVTPGEGRSAVLWRDIHIVLSQIYRKDGQAFRSLWEQYRADSMATSTKVQAVGFTKLVQANRAIRLGVTSLGIANLREASGLLSLPDQRRRAELELVKVLRLSGDFAGSKERCEKVLGENDLSDDFRIEFEWELICQTAQQTGQVDEMVINTQKGKRFYSMGFIQEAAIWALAHQKVGWAGRIPNMITLSKRVDLATDTKLPLFRCTKGLQECYDNEIPMELRISRLGHILDLSRKLVTIDLELLVWAAAGRFLARRKLFELAFFVLNEYRQTSLKLTNGKDADIIRVSFDLQERPWFQNLLNGKAAE